MIATLISLHETADGFEDDADASLNTRFFNNKTELDGSAAAATVFGR